MPFEPSSSLPVSEGVAAFCASSAAACSSAATARAHSCAAVTSKAISTTVRTVSASRPGSMSSWRGSSRIESQLSSAASVSRVAATVTSASALGSGRASPFSIVSGSSARSATGLGVTRSSRHSPGRRTPRLGTTYTSSCLNACTRNRNACVALGFRAHNDALGKIHPFSRSTTAQLSSERGNASARRRFAVSSTPSASRGALVETTESATSDRPCRRVSHASRLSSESASLSTSRSRRSFTVDGLPPRLASARAVEVGVGEATATCRTTGAISCRSLLGKEDSYAA